MCFFRFHSISDQAAPGPMTLWRCGRHFWAVLSQVPFSALSHAFLRPQLEQGWGSDWSRVHTNTSFCSVCTRRVHSAAVESMHCPPSGATFGVSRQKSGRATTGYLGWQCRGLVALVGMASAPAFPTFCLPWLPQSSCWAHKEESPVRLVTHRVITTESWPMSASSCLLSASGFQGFSRWVLLMVFR